MNENTAVFEMNNISYPITQQVYRCIQDYLYDKENVVWVDYNPPFIEYQMRIDDNKKNIKRQAKIILNNSEIGEYVLKNTSIKPLKD